MSKSQNRAQVILETAIHLKISGLSDKEALNRAILTVPASPGMQLLARKLYNVLLKKAKKDVKNAKKRKNVVRSNKKNSSSMG